jgi:hypothetical protein
MCVDELLIWREALSRYATGWALVMGKLPISEIQVLSEGLNLILSKLSQNQIYQLDTWARKRNSSTKLQFHSKVSLKPRGMRLRESQFTQMAH